VADLNLKALRALRSLNGRIWPPVTMDELIEGWNALPALLDLGDAVRELAPVLAILSADNKHPMQPAARRVLAILDTNPTNEGA